MHVVSDVNLLGNRTIELMYGMNASGSVSIRYQSRIRLILAFFELNHIDNELRYLL